MSYHVADDKSMCEVLSMLLHDMNEVRSTEHKRTKAAKRPKP